MYDDDRPEPPIRTRGAILRRPPEGRPTLGGVRPAPATRSVLGRRATLGAPPPPSPYQVETPEAVTKLQELRDLGGLLTWIWEQTGGYPLTVVVHGWGTEAVSELLQALDPHRGIGDALHLVPSPVTPEPLPDAPAGSVVLNLAEPLDAGFCSAIVADLLFLPGLDAKEGETLSKWVPRTRALLVDDRGSHAAALLQEAKEEKLVAFTWSGGTDVRYV